jgi:hypothetical protein
MAVLISDVRVMTYSTVRQPLSNFSAIFHLDVQILFSSYNFNFVRGVEVVSDVKGVSTVNIKPFKAEARLNNI